LDQLSGLLVLPRKKEFPIPQIKDRTARRDRQARELEQNQNDLRASIAESKRLVDEAEEMIRRHRDECEAADGRS
jgi:N-methylhydantoinase B/oxoprolinase/acetone carboxylase alpha subunit